MVSHYVAINNEFLCHDFLWLRGPCSEVVNVNNIFLVLVSQKKDPEKGLRFRQFIWEVIERVEKVGFKK
jgi:hypothetical protein